MSNFVNIDGGLNALKILARYIEWEKVPKEFIQLIEEEVEVVGPKVTELLIQLTKEFALRNPKEIVSIKRTHKREFKELHEPIGKILRIDEYETDERSIRMLEVNLHRLKLRSVLREGEENVLGKERKARLTRMAKKEIVRLDAEFLIHFSEHQEDIPENWKQKVEGNLPLNIFFDGTALVDPTTNDKYFLYMRWTGTKWLIGARCIDAKWFKNDLSIVLETGE